MRTQLGSLNHYEKGGVRVITNDDPKNYAFSNAFEIASKAKPYERVAAGKNLKYVIEVVRAEGDSPWYSADHDESALLLDGEVEIHFLKPDRSPVPPGKEGAVKLSAQPTGKTMGWVKLGLGHMALLPKGSAYQFSSSAPSVVIIQTMQGDCTVERWAEICQIR